MPPHPSHVPELASYVHRQGTERLILLPVNLAARVISIAFMLCIMGFIPFLLDQLAPDQAMSFADVMPFMAIGLVRP